MERFIYDIENIPRSEWISLKQTRRVEGNWSRSTLYRWVNKGAKGSDGTRVFLPVFTFNGKRYFTKEALRWFMHAQNEDNYRALMARQARRAASTAVEQPQPYRPSPKSKS